MDLIQVSFKNDNIEIIKDSQAVVVKDICNAIGIDYIKQYKKIKADPSYQSKLIKVQTNGGMQEVFCIPLNKLNGWLFSINPNRVKPEVRDKLIEYKNECFEVLHRYFELKHQMQNNKSSSSQIPNSSVKELQEIILKQNALIAATTQNINIEQSKHKHLTELYEKTLNENETLKQKMKQQLSLIVSQVGKDIITRFEESLDVTSRSLELQHKK